MVNRIMTILYVGLVMLGLALTIPWWALIGWVAMHIVNGM